MTEYRYKPPNLVIITKDEKEIYFHKEPLCAHSNYFKAMFTHEMVEKKENKVKLDDNYDDLVIFLDVFQTVGVLTIKNVKVVFDIAHKYGFDEIIQKCFTLMELNTGLHQGAKELIDEIVFTTSCYDKYAEDEKIQTQLYEIWDALTDKLVECHEEITKEMVLVMSHEDLALLFAHTHLMYKAEKDKNKSNVKTYKYDDYSV